MALNLPECYKLLGPTVPGTTTPHGVRPSAGAEPEP